MVVATSILSKRFLITKNLFASFVSLYCKPESEVMAVITFFFYTIYYCDDNGSSSSSSSINDLNPRRLPKIALGEPSALLLLLLLSFLS